MVRWCRRNYEDSCDCVYCERERDRRHGSEGVTSVTEGEPDDR